MMWTIPFAMTLGAGWLLARGLTAGGWNGPRWATFLVELSLGALFGPGLGSVLYFAMVAAGVANRTSVFAMLLASLGASAASWWRLAPPPSALDFSAKRIFPWTWALWAGVALGFLFFVLDFQAASSANPAGEWDAMSIWNLRAHYLTSGADLWRRAVSMDLGGHMTGAAHPGYPLFLSGFLAMQWTTGGFDEAASIWTSFLFAAGNLVLLGASIASRKSTALGLLAWLVLLASEVFASQAAAQYSDLLQGLAFLSALVLLEAAADHVEPRISAAAGLAIGLAGWIKNEGLPFALAALCVAAWRFRGPKLIWVGIGAVPGFLATAVLKLFVAHGTEAIFPHTMGEAMDKIAGAGRWWQAALGFGKAVYDAGNLWTHPVLLAALLALALRFVPRAEWRARWWLAIPICVTAAAEYGLYLITTADLNWHISTSVSRLVAQLWPSLIWLFFLTLRAPEEMVASVAPASAAPAATTKARKRR